MSSVIFNGNFVKTLKPNIKIGDVAHILTGSIDPKVTPVDAPIGSLFIRDNGEVYIKLDSGNTTNFKHIVTSEG